MNLTVKEDTLIFSPDRVVQRLAEIVKFEALADREITGYAPDRVSISPWRRGWLLDTGMPYLNQDNSYLNYVLLSTGNKKKARLTMEESNSRWGILATERIGEITSQVGLTEMGNSYEILGLRINRDFPLNRHFSVYKLDRGKKIRREEVTNLAGLRMKLVAINTQRGVELVRASYLTQDTTLMDGKSFFNSGEIFEKKDLFNQGLRIRKDVDYLNGILI